MAGIPFIRDELISIAESLSNHPDYDVRVKAGCIAILALATLRDRQVNKAPPSASPITDTIKNAVWKLHNENPQLRGDEIGSMLNINQGRVYEILTGQR